MKIARLFLAASASLVALSTLSAMESDSHFGQRFIHNYYKNPQPQDLIAAINNLDQNGFLDTAANREQAMGFLSVVFQNNPAEVTGWLETSSRVLQDRAQRLMAAAAWFAGYPQGTAQVHRLASRASDAVQQQTEGVIAHSRPTPVAAMTVSSEPTLNLQLGAFLASGDRQYVDNIFTAVASEEPGLSSSAKFALAQSAAADPQFMEVCQTELARQPASVRQSFEAALNETNARKPGA
jgi:hypothetical protein